MIKLCRDRKPPVLIPFPPKAVFFSVPIVSLKFCHPVFVPVHPSTMKFSVFPVPKDPEIAIREPTDLLTMLPTLQFITDESGTAVRIPTPQSLSICRELLLGNIRSATLQIKIKQILTIHDRYPTNPAGLCQEPGDSERKRVGPYCSSCSGFAFPEYYFDRSQVRFLPGSERKN